MAHGKNRKIKIKTHTTFKRLKIKNSFGGTVDIVVSNLLQKFNEIDEMLAPPIC
jgi:hypothetical protein